MRYLAPIDPNHPEFGLFFDELPLWSAPFGLLLLEHVPLAPAITVLDIGAGTGFLSIELAQRCGPHSQIIAVDPWVVAMERLGRKLAFLDISNVRLLQQSAEHLDLPDDSVDVIVSNLGLNNFEDTPSVLRICFRVAKPGCIFVATTNTIGHMKEFYQVFRNVLLDQRLEEYLDAFDHHHNHRGTRDSLVTLFTRAGFLVTDTVTDAFVMRFVDGSSFLNHFFIRLGFLPGWRDIVPAERRSSVFRALEHQLNRVAEEKGELALTIPMLCITAVKPN